MSRYRLLPAPAQEAVLRDHCAHARYVWNLTVEQHAHWHPGRKSAPGYLEQCRQLTAARAEHDWLRTGSQMVQQQALRDFTQAMAVYFDPANPARRPTWRKAGWDEGFRAVALKPAEVRRLSRHTGEVRVPKAGWVRFRWSRAVPPGVKSYRVTRDRTGRWHIAFAAIPTPVPAPNNGQAVSIDRGVVVRRAIARLKARETDRRKDWAEKASTSIARRFDVIRVEDLKIAKMTRSAKGRVEKVSAVFTSQRCSACGQVDADSRESQARFVCMACGYACHADVNAARNIAAGHPAHLPFPLHARGGCRDTGPVNREPHLLAS
jgi:putative transposase